MQGPGVALLIEEYIYIFVGREQVVAGVYREEQHVDEARLYRHAGHERVVAAHAYVAYLALGLQPLGNLDNLVVEDRVKILLGIDVVNHAHIDMVGAQLLEQGVERLDGLLRVAGAQVLVVLPGGAQVSLYDEAVAAALQCLPDVVAQVGVRRVEVDKVDAPVDGKVEVGLHLLSAFVDKALTAEGNGTYPYAGTS